MRPFRVFSKILLLALLACLAACNKPDPVPPNPETYFQITFDNEFTELEAHYAAWLSDENGQTIAFRWLKGTDTTELRVRDWPEGKKVDLSILRVREVDATGSGVLETSVFVQTFSQVADSMRVYLRPDEFRETIDLKVSFTGITSFDSIIVPDGLTFARPQWANNFNGQYRVLHTGRVWLRVLINGDPTWRFIFFENVGGQQLPVTLDATVLRHLNPPKTIALPFTSNWQYRIDGAVDTAQHQFFPLGDLRRAPGGAVAVFNSLAVYEPIPFDPTPPPLPYKSFRLKFTGTDTDGLGYWFDQFRATIPGSLPDPTFNLAKTTLGDNRLAGVKCTGDFDRLVLTRQKAGSPSLLWEASLPPEPTVFHRLPDVPEEIGDLFPGLRDYDFGGSVRARAEQYERLSGYEAVLQKIFQNNDPLWQPKAALLGKEIPL